MLSSVSSLFDKNFVIGFLLPALLATLAAAFAFPDLAALQPLTNLAIKDKDLGDFAYVILGVTALALLLMAGNNALYRALEGYTPPLSWMGPLRARQARRFNRVKSRYDELMAAWRAQAGKFPQESQIEAARLRRRWVGCLPTAESELLPTGFGNVIKAFEVYPREAYGADSIPLWPRLMSVTPKDYLAQIDDARAQVDCFVNLTFLALAMLLAAAVLLGADLVEAGRYLAAAGQDGWSHALGLIDRRRLLVGVLSLGVAAAAYHWAVALAAIWGETVKAAFDCYLPALAKQLGYQLPATDAERHAFWGELNALFNYQQALTKDRWPRADAAAAPAQPKPKPKPKRRTPARRAPRASWR